MPEWLQILTSVGAVLTPFAIAALARDRVLFTMIQQVKDDAEKTIKAATDPLHDRINRVRDEYVREDHFRADMARIDKRFDDMAAEQRRTNDQLSEIHKLLIERSNNHS